MNMLKKNVNAISHYTPRYPVWKDLWVYVSSRDHWYYSKLDFAILCTNFQFYPVGGALENFMEWLEEKGNLVIFNAIFDLDFDISGKWKNQKILHTSLYFWNVV